MKLTTTKKGGARAIERVAVPAAFTTPEALTSFASKLPELAAAAHDALDMKQAPAQYARNVRTVVVTLSVEVRP